jgi:hypothetical protein
MYLGSPPELHIRAKAKGESLAVSRRARSARMSEGRAALRQGRPAAGQGTGHGK